MASTLVQIQSNPVQRWLQNNTDDDDDNSSKKVASATLSYIFLFFLIFGLSATVDVKNLKRQLTNKFAIGAGVAMQFLIMPLLGFIAVIILKGHLTKAMAITLLVVTSSPGGSYSNWWCSTFNADLALSVAMTTVSSLLSIALLPANLLMYSFFAFGVTEEESVLDALDFSTLFISLGIVLGAIITGLCAGYRWDYPKFHIWANRFGSISGLLLILFGVFLSTDAEGAEFWNLSWAFYVGVALPCLLGIALANIIARSLRLSRPETVAISIECCYQNTGIATATAITMFEDETERAQAVAVPLFYGVVEAVAIGIYCIWAWKMGWTKAPPDENFCVVIAKTYEVEDEMEDIDDEDDDADAEENEEEDEAGHDSFCREAECFEDEHEMEAGFVSTVSIAQGEYTDQRSDRESRGTERGFWGHIARMFSRRSAQESQGVELMDAEPKLKPAGKAEDEMRNRLVSADLTAETSTCSSLACPSPGTADQPAYEINTADGPQLPFTIPEVPASIEGEEDASPSLHSSVQVTYDDEDALSPSQSSEDSHVTD